MAKGTYRSVAVKAVDVERLAAESGGQLGVSIDVAMEKQYAGFFRPADGRVLLTVRWSHPAETLEFFALVERLRGLDVAVEAAMEPTGTYGDPIRAGLWSRDVRVFRLSGKRVKDAREVFDGVPSQHDAKSVHLIARLHSQGLSELWPLRTEAERAMRAKRQWLDHWASQEIVLTNRIGSQLAGYWPEVTVHLPAMRTTLLRLLAAYGGPAGVARSPAEARALLRHVGRAFLADETIVAVVASASQTLGQEMTGAEVEYLKELAEEALRTRTKRQEVEKDVRALSREQVPEVVVRMVGTAAATALIAHNITPTKYPTARAFLKALGLNLRENSSGKTGEDPPRHITKRGPGTPRQLLYLATLRAVRSDDWCRAWYEAKRRRDGGGKKAPKALVALMRKLARALFCVWTKGEAFDASRLFDTTRLVARRAA